MESSKIALRNLFTEKQWRQGHRERTGGYGGERGVGPIAKGAPSCMHDHASD